MTQVGMVVVFYGDFDGLDSTHFEKFTQISVAGAANESGDLFGWSLAAGDLDDDGFDDLAVGMPYQDSGSTLVDTGAVAIMYGSGAGLLPSRTELVTQSSISYVRTAHDRFGYSLTIGDFDGDDYDDLAIGIPYDNLSGLAEGGRVAVLYGASSGVLPATWETIDQEELTGSESEPEDRFGFALASGDLDSDGDDELIIGTPYEDAGSIPDVGMVAVFKGSSSGLLPSDDVAYFEEAVAGNTAEADDRFGFAVAVGDFNGDGFGDVAASAPYESVSFDSDGMVAILPGKAGSHPTTWTESVTEASAYGTREAGDNTGFALAAGDFDGDGLADLAVGVPYEDVDREENGAVLAYFGSSAGLLPARSYWFTQSYIGGGEEDDDRFGFVLAAGDFDGDGVSSLAAGSPYEDVGTVDDAGAVFVRTIEPALPAVVGQTAIVIDRPSGKVLGVKFPDRLRAPASTTKMMTMLLAAEAIEAGQVALTDTVVIPFGFNAEDTCDFMLSDTISLRDLLHMVMLPSDNCAANAVGIHVAGTRTAFLGMMNTRAAQLGMNDTSYVSISGRDPEDFIPGCSNDEFTNPACAHYSTARDLARLARFALDVPLFASLAGKKNWNTTTWRRTVRIPGHEVEVQVLDRTLRNTNNLLFNNGGYPGAYGVKTGTTEQAGSNLVSAALVSGEDVIAVILGSDPDGTQTGDRYTDSTTLLNFGIATAP